MIFLTAGVPFNDSVNWRLAIAEQGQQILGENLLGLQAGNEPDFYQTFVRRGFLSFFQQSDSNPFRFGTRPAPYGPSNYSEDFGNLIAAMEADPGIPNKNMLIAPSVATGPWTPEDVWNTGFIENYGDHLFCLSVEQ